jgi:2-desacetyl-2-hydroxyethyl bacteriochlorophyllide A dehydrogenase
MKDQIKAAFLVSPKEVSIREIPAPKLGKEDVLIQPVLTAICGSDVSFFMGHRSPPAYPIILGHEVVGIVIAVGSEVTTVSAGKRVIVEPNYPCGVCSFCSTGRGNICPNKKSLGVTIPGCFAQQFIAPSEFTWIIPDTISDENAVTIEPLAVSLHALWQSNVQPGNTIAVVGCGSTGLLLIQAATAQGVRVFAHDKIVSKLEMARDLGAEISDNPDITKLWQAEGVVAIFECAGASASVELALKAAPRGSQIVLMGLSSSPASFEPLRFVREGLRVSGSIIYHHPEDFSRTIALVDKQVLSPKKIISQVVGFENIQEAMQIASTGEKGKILLEMGRG